MQAVIPVPVVAVAARVERRAFKPWWFGYWLAAAFLLATGAGAIVWGASSSPFALRRFPQVGFERTVNLTRTGTYVIFEEYPGAAQPALPPPLDIRVKERNGTTVRVNMLQEPGQVADVPAYRTPWHEGRAIATFTITRSGRYQIAIDPALSGSQDPALYTGLTNASMAVGHEVSTSWLNSMLALVPLVAVPMLAATVLIVVTRRARRTSPPEPGGLADPSARAGSVLAHG